jgi:predicted dehydrogenase
MIRAAVIGVGHLGQHHARVYSQLKGCKLVGVADADQARAQEIAKKLKCQAFGSPAELLGRVDAVSVVVPTALHFEVASLFLKEGVHCLLEKPMTVDLAEADALLALAAKHKALLQVGHIERFNPAILALHQFKLQPLFIEAHRLGPYSPRNTDIGVVLELMIHDIDIVLAMVDKKITRVEAVGIPVLSHTEDIANVRLNFEGGCVANLTASRVTTKKERKIRVFSKEAYASVDYLAKEARLYKLKDGADPSQAGSLIGLSRMVVSETLKIKDEEQLKLELEAFVDSVAGGKSAVVTGQQGRDAVALGLEIQRQILAHRKEVLG